MSKMTAIESCNIDFQKNVRKIKMKRVVIGMYYFNSAYIKFCLSVCSVEWFRWKN